MAERHYPLAEMPQINAATTVRVTADSEKELFVQKADVPLKTCLWRDLSREQKTISVLLIVILVLIIAFIAVICSIPSSGSTSTSLPIATQSTNRECHINTSTTFASLSVDDEVTDQVPVSDRVDSANVQATPKNLIVMIGDGMGTVYNTAYRLYRQQARSLLDELYKGRYSTNPMNMTTTDSAAGATAFSTASKTINGYVAVDMNGNPLGTILEALKRQGKGTALIATKAITDATPASFGAHSLTRGFQKLIAQQLATMHEKYEWTNCTVTDIMMGGGKQYFDGIGFNATTYTQHGWNRYITDNASLYTLCKEDLPVVGLFAETDIPYYLDLKQTANNTQPSLLDMSRTALHLLNETYHEQGFFMMIEGSRIDSCGHLNDIACLLGEMQQFVETVEYVTKWATMDEDTLVVILADHQTGGLTIGRQNVLMRDQLMEDFAYALTVEQVLEFYSDYSLDALVTTRSTDYTVARYMWNPEIIHQVTHTTQWLNDTITATNNSMAAEDIFRLIEQHWFPLTEKEKHFLNTTFEGGGRLDQALAHVVNIRTSTGFSTHGHTAVDVSVYAMGVSSDAFIGHWSNDEIGQLLTKIMNCSQEQKEQTALLQQMFINGDLQICDASDKPMVPPLEWNESVPFPWGNSKYPQNCVDAWV